MQVEVDREGGRVVVGEGLERSFMAPSPTMFNNDDTIYVV